jgi:hypothetical protein
MKPIFTPEKVIEYAHARYSGNNVNLDEINKVEQHNGSLPPMLEQELIHRFGDFSRVGQEHYKEPLYVVEKTLFQPQYSSVERGKRCKRTIEKYIEASGRKDLVHEVYEYNSQERRTLQQYENFAYDFVAGLFVPEKTYEDRRVFGSFEINDIDKIIFGPLDAVKEQARVVHKGESRYLDAQIVEIGGEPVLNLGYVYGKQGGIIINKMTREYKALAEKANRERNIDIYMFGRVGGLKEGMKLHDLIFPTSIIDWSRLKHGNTRKYPIENLLNSTGFERVILNVTSVLDETEEQLLEARECGCIGLEMELRSTSMAVDQACNDYEDRLRVRLGFVGHVSDLPMEGDTLGTYRDCSEGEQAAVAEIVDSIKKSR